MRVLVILFSLFSIVFGEIRAVIFDFGGVICEVDRQRVARFLCSSLNISDDEALRLLKEAYDSPLSLKEFCIQRGMSEAFAEQFFQVCLHALCEVPGMLPLIEQLKASGLRIGLLSNVSKKAADFVRSLGYYDGFDPKLLSCETGYLKPDPQAFMHLIEHLDILPNEILFVDDKCCNIEAAARLGIQTHQFVDAPFFKRELERLGLLELESVDLGTHTLWVDTLGRRKDPAILLIAGANCHAHFWSDKLAVAFARQGLFVIRYDQRDVGLSSPWKEAYRLEDLADDAVLILHHYGLDQAHVVGHSMGGYIAQFLAARHPKVVKTLTAIATAPIGVTAQTERPLPYDERQILDHTLDLMFANTPTRDFADSLPKYIAVWSYTNGDYPLDIAMVTSYVKEIYFRSQNPPQFALHHLQAMEQMMNNLGSNRDLFSRIQMPTLVIHGAKDPLILPHRGGIALFKALPQAELKLFPKMGHVLFNRDLEHQLIETVKEFICRHGA